MLDNFNVNNNNNNDLASHAIYIYEHPRVNKHKSTLVTQRSNGRPTLPEADRSLQSTTDTAQRHVHPSAAYSQRFTGSRTWADVPMCGHVTCYVGALTKICLYCKSYVSREQFHRTGNYQALSSRIPGRIPSLWASWPNSYQASAILPSGPGFPR